MMLSGYDLFKGAFIVACTVLMLMASVQQATASSFAGLNMFGYPVSGGGLSGISDITSNSGVFSANSASYSPSNQFSGYFGSGVDGIQAGTIFTWPTATHDASTMAYSRNIAFESVLGDDAVSFPDIDVDLGSSWSSFPTIKSDNADIKYMESVQFTLSTESDTMPITTGFSFPGFFSSWM